MMKCFELEEINSEFSHTDAAIELQTTSQPAAKTDKTSLLCMPIFDVENSDNALFVKRSMAWYAGVDNDCF